MSRGPSRREDRCEGNIGEVKGGECGSQGSEGSKKASGRRAGGEERALRQERGVWQATFQLRRSPRRGLCGVWKGGWGCLTGRAMWSGSCVRGLRFVFSAWDAVEGHSDC